MSQIKEYEYIYHNNERTLKLNELVNYTDQKLTYEFIDYYTQLHKLKIDKDVISEINDYPRETKYRIILYCYMKLKWNKRRNK